MQSTRLGMKESLLATQRTFSSTSPPRNIPQLSRGAANFIQEVDKAFASLNEPPPTRQTETVRRVWDRSTGYTDGAARPMSTVATSSFRTLRGPVPPRGVSPTGHSLPLYSYKKVSPDATVIYIRDAVQADEEVVKLEGPLGFDMEWKAWGIRGGGQSKTAVIQICDEKTILVLQISAMGVFPSKVKELIENPDIFKLGVNIKGDGSKLSGDYGINAKGLVELKALIEKYDQLNNYRPFTLQSIVERYTGCTLDKGPVRTSNWERTLSAHQLNYAANDAHCAVQIYNIISNRATEQVDLGQLADQGQRKARTTTQTAIRHEIMSEAEYVSRISRMHISQLEQEEKVLTTAGASPTTVVAVEGGSRPRKGVFGDGASSSGDALSTVTGEVSSSGTRKTGSTNGSGNGVRPSHIRAYELWHEQGLELEELRRALRSEENPLAASTVVNYVIKAIINDRTLEWDKERLITLVQDNEWMWKRHQRWILRGPN